MPSPKTKRQDGWATSLLGWAGAPFGWFGAKTANGTTLQPPGAATRGSGAIEGRNPYDYVLPGYAGFNGEPSGFCGIPGMGGIRWPGTYSTYRIMMSHPTVALSRASVHAPVLAGSWFYESHAEDENEDACELVQKIMEKSRQRWLTDALRSLDFGFQAFEMTFDRDDEGYAIPTLKPLLPELTTIEVDANGNVSGIRNGDTTLKPGEFVLINYDVEGSNYYGRSRLENIRRVWANYLAIEDQGYLLDKKAAGTVPIVLYPSDTSVPTTSDPNATGDGKSNLAVAQSIVQALQNHRGVAIENFAGMAPDTPEQAAVLAGKADYVIDIKDFGNTGPSQSAILEKLRYYDQMLVRGYLRSERTVIEANTAGSRADSESHTASISDTDTDLIHAMIVEQFNRQVVDEMLAQNFGESARGTVWISPREVVDERRATMNLLLQAALADPMLRGELFERIDKDSLFQWAGVKLMEDARPWDDMPTVDEQKDQSIEHAAKMAEATGGNDKTNLSRELIELDRSEGEWKTINGSHVLIEDGKVTKGPEGIVGKTAEKIGKGNTGDVHKVGDKVIKNHKGKEGEVYSKLGGKSGISEGERHGEHVITPHYKHVLSADAVPADRRKSMGSFVSKNAGNMLAAVNTLSDAGYSYNDPLQFGVDADRGTKLFDFSNASKTTPEEARRENMGLLKSFMSDFGAGEEASRIGETHDTLDASKKDSAVDFFDDGVQSRVKSSKSEGGDYTHAYYAKNAREIGIKGIAQSSHERGFKTVLSKGRLSDDDIKKWELTPVIH